MWRHNVYKMLNKLCIEWSGQVLVKQLEHTWKKDDPDVISRRFNGSCSLSVKKKKNNKKIIYV